MCSTFQICLSGILLLLEAYFHISQTFFHLPIWSLPLSLQALYFLTYCPVPKQLSVHLMIAYFSCSNSENQLPFYTILQHAAKTNFIPQDRKHAFKFVQHPLHAQCSANIGSRQKFLILRTEQSRAEQNRAVPCETTAAGGTGSRAAGYRAVGSAFRRCNKFRRLLTILLRGLDL